MHHSLYRQKKHHTQFPGQHSNCRVGDAAAYLQARDKDLGLLDLLGCQINEQTFLKFCQLIVLQQRPEVSIRPKTKVLRWKGKLADKYVHGQRHERGGW